MKKNTSSLYLIFPLECGWLSEMSIRLWRELAEHRTFTANQCKRWKASGRNWTVCNWIITKLRFYRAVITVIWARKFSFYRCFVSCLHYNPEFQTHFFQKLKITKLISVTHVRPCRNSWGTSKTLLPELYNYCRSRWKKPHTLYCHRVPNYLHVECVGSSVGTLKELSLLMKKYLLRAKPFWFLLGN